jgi:hypothetical protein
MNIIEFKTSKEFEAYKQKQIQGTKIFFKEFKTAPQIIAVVVEPENEE